MTSVDGGQGINGVNGGEYVITISKEGGIVSNNESIHMRAAIKESVTEALASENNPIKQLATTATAREIRSEDKELQNRLLNSLKEIIITLATFFIYFISFIGSFQQPSHDHFRYIVVGVLLALIWFFTGLLVYIWWSELTSIRVDIIALNDKKQQPSDRCGGKWHLCRALVVILGVVETVFSVYFAYILCSQWSSGSSPAPSPSALQLPSNVTMDTQYYAFH